MADSTISQGKATHSLNFRNRFENPQKYFYICQVNAIKITTSDATENQGNVTNITGIHLEGKSNTDVIVFTSVRKKFEKFPRNLPQFFPNIDKIQISTSNIRTLTRDDLEAFGGKLKELYFVYNALEVIEGDLFEGTPNLEVVELSGNKITRVDPGAFSRLQKLSSLHFSFNPCYSSYANDRKAVIELVGKIVEACLD